MPQINSALGISTEKGASSPSLAALSRSNLENLDRLARSVADIVKRAYGSVLFFEHGMMNTYQRAGGCIDHAHLHCFPRFVNVAKELIPYFQIQQIGSLVELEGFYRKKTPYVLISDEACNFYVAEAHAMRSQLLREIVGTNVGEPLRWDWRKYPFVDNMNNTFKRLRPLFNRPSEDNIEGKTRSTSLIDRLEEPVHH